MTTGDVVFNITSMYVTQEDDEANKQTASLRASTGTSGKYWNITITKDVTGVIEGPLDPTKTYTVKVTED